MKPLQIDDALLREVGLGDLPEEYKVTTFGYIREVLEFRIGEALSKGLPKEVLAEFYSHVKNGRREEILKWMQKNAPNRAEVASVELDKLKRELELDAKRILANIKLSEPESPGKNR